MKDYFMGCKVAEEEKPTTEMNIKELISKTMKILFESKNELGIIKNFLIGENFNTDEQVNCSSMKEEVLCIYFEARENSEIIYEISKILGAYSDVECDDRCSK